MSFMFKRLSILLAALLTAMSFSVHAQDADEARVKQAVQAYRARATQAAQVLLHQAAAAAVVLG